MEGKETITSHYGAAQEWLHHGAEQMLLCQLRILPSHSQDGGGGNTLELTGGQLVLDEEQLQKLEGGGDRDRLLFARKGCSSHCH